MIWMRRTQFVALILASLSFTAIADPPQLLQSWSGFPSSVTDLVISGDNLWCLGYDDVLYHIDLTSDDPADTVLTIPSVWSHKLLVDGTKGVVSIGRDGLQMLNFSDPDLPQLAAVLRTPGEPYELTMYDGYLFVTTNYSGVLIVNIDDVNAPEIVAILPFYPGDSIYRMRILGDVLYLIQQYKLTTYDLTDIEYPVLIDSQPYNATYFEPDGENVVVFYGESLFDGYDSWAAGQMNLLTDDEGVLACTDTLEFEFTYYTTFDAIYRNGIAYVSWAGEWRIFEITQDHTFNLLYQLGGHGVKASTTDGEYLYAIEGGLLNKYTLCVPDPVQSNARGPESERVEQHKRSQLHYPAISPSRELSGPAPDRHISDLELYYHSSVFLPNESYFKQAILQDTLLFVLSGGYGEHRDVIRIHNASDLDNLQQREILYGTPEDMYCIAVNSDNSRLYLGHWQGMEVYDITVPGEPEVVGIYDGGCRSMHLTDNYLYRTDGNNLQMFELHPDDTMTLIYDVEDEAEEFIVNPTGNWMVCILSDGDPLYPVYFSMLVDLRRFSPIPYFTKRLDGYSRKPVQIMENLIMRWSSDEWLEYSTHSLYDFSDPWYHIGDYYYVWEPEDVLIRCPVQLEDKLLASYWDWQQGVSYFKLFDGWDPDSSNVVWYQEFEHQVRQVDYPYVFAADTSRVYLYELLGSTDAPESPEDNPSQLPSEMQISNAYPNPFNASTTITVELPHAAQTTLTVFDITGREVAQLVDGMMTAGNHRVQFYAGGLASGVYLARLEADGIIDTRKLVLLK